MQADSNGALKGHIYFNYYSHYLYPSSSSLPLSPTPLPQESYSGNVEGEKIEEGCVSLKGHTLLQ